MKKAGFTMIELLITCFILMVVLIVTPMVILKKKVRNESVQDYNSICKCNKDAVSSDNCTVVKNVNGHTYCKFNANNIDAEFYTFNMIGGGGGGITQDGYKGGRAGESKTTSYLKIKGTICIRIGNGGTSGTDGEETIILNFPDDFIDNCQDQTYNYKNSNDGYLFAYALGGVAISELTNYDEEKEGETAALDTTYGKGGSSGAESANVAQSGSVTIRW